MNTLCIECYFKKHLSAARSLGSEEKATAFGKALMRKFLEQPDSVDSTMMGAIAKATFLEHYGCDPDSREEEKEMSNRFVLERLAQIEEKIQSAPDPVYAGLQYAALGNYLDFSALRGRVSFETMEEMLSGAEEIAFDREVYNDFLADLEKGKRVLYLTDNAGEIVFDRLCAEQLQRTFPHLEITFCVRGGPIVNDATREDAQAVGIPFPVIDSGTAIGGTQLHLIGETAKKAIENADVIIAKGMGNTESLYGSGYNIYYAFMVKCARFQQVFHKPMFSPVLAKERK